MVQELKNQNIAIYQNLLDAGCDAQLIELFFQLQTEEKNKEQVKLLSIYRQSLLDKIHKNQKHLDLLDFLMYNLKKKGDKNELL